MNRDYEILDKYYTKNDVALECIKNTKSILKKASYKIGDLFFIEPSAGSGSFLKNLKNNHSVGFDLLPTNYGIVKADFLNDELGLEHHINNVIIGNPPFGKKGKLAIDFINKGLTLSDVVCFILPFQFKKWSVQKQINVNAKLIFEKDLKEDSFTFVDDDYSLRCCFQIWVNNNTRFDKFENLRIQSSPETKHDDFVMFQYNCTKEAEKFFDYDWDFAVLRQGWGDFNKLYTKDDTLDKKKQWIFFKANDEKILNKLKNIDFDKLASLNTSVKGFGKADVVSYYNANYVFNFLKTFYD